MLTLGLMSGTSADGVDAVLAEWPELTVNGLPDASDSALINASNKSSRPSSADKPRVLGHLHRAFDSELRKDLLALNRSGADELHRAALAANALARVYAQVVAELLAQTGQRAQDVHALGAHGQTVRHQPGLHDGSGYTLQLLNGALLAELSGIGVVCDLRSRDVAAGGQGAPLVPALHQALFSEAHADVAVLNVGGIANLSLLPAQTHASSQTRPVLGFDCGPGNALMDAWCEQHLGQRYDDQGHWAAGGVVDAVLLQALLAEPFFQQPPPKSTGRDLFDLPWLAHRLAAYAGAGVANPAPSAQDVQATLAELTARSAAQALLRHAPQTRVLRVCGGGALNRHLMQRLSHHLSGLTVTDTAAVGIPVDQVEALAFAWLAKAFMQAQPGNLPSVTGAHGLRRLGAWYPAG